MRKVPRRSMCPYHRPIYVLLVRQYDGCWAMRAEFRDRTIALREAPRVLKALMAGPRTDPYKEVAVIRYGDPQIVWERGVE